MTISVDQIRQAGIVGAGGAGFPTHVKLASRADTIILNAAECEPLLHKDKEVLREFPAQVLEGLTEAMGLVGAKRALVGIKNKYEDVIAELRPLLGSGLEIVPLPDAYPAGDEFVLVYEATGRVIAPGGIPLHVGAVVINVETAFNIAAAPKTAVIEKFVSVAGAVAQPMTVRVPVGATLRQCIQAAGGTTVDNASYLVGGIMMGRLEENLDALVTKTTGAVIALPTDHQVIKRYRREWKQMARIGRSACDQCTFCTELCPRYLLGHPIEPHKAMRSLGFNQIGQANVIGTAYCCSCNLCSMYSCPEDLDPASVCTENKRRLAAEKRRWNNPPFNPARPALHAANRRAPMKRLMQKLGLGQFRNVGPMLEQRLTANRVGIALAQHIGAPCQPCVKAGQSVAAGEKVGEVPVVNGKAALGAPVHASISGVVASIADGVVWIERR